MSSITFPYGEILSGLNGNSSTKLTFNQQTKKLRIESVITIDLTNIKHKFQADSEIPEEPGLVNLKLNVDIHDDNPQADIMSVENDLFFLQKKIKVNGIKKDHSS